MAIRDINQQFSDSFKHGASEIAASQFSNSIRFMAILFVLLGVMWCVHSFMDIERRQADDFLVVLGSRVIRLVLACCLFILILMVKGN